MIDAREVTKKSGPIRILVVDDNPAALYATARVLRSAGYEVLEATTGAAGLEAAPLADLVVLDINLPDMDGFEVCRRIRASPRTAGTSDFAPFGDLHPIGRLHPGFRGGRRQLSDAPRGGAGADRDGQNAAVCAACGSGRAQGGCAPAGDVRTGAVAIAVLDDALTLESVNPAFCALTGYAPSELIGRKFAACLSDSPGNERELAVMEAAIRERYSGHFIFRHKNGSLAEIQGQVARESVSGARILVAEDVSAQLQSERARESLLSSERAARAAAERSNRLKEEFLATLSHELRNPLNAILGWATLLNRRPGLPEAVTQGLRAIERNSRIQARMISDLLDYAGITFGKVRLVIETVDPYPIVRATIESVSDAAQAAGVELRFSGDEEIVRIEADPARLQQIVWNLLTNAIKFSPKGAAVDVTAGRHGDAFRLVVRDYGEGIETEFLPRIFERFSQQDATTTRSHGGLGLGWPS